MTGSDKVLIVFDMRRVALILLFAIALGVFIPPAMSVMLADQGSAAIGTLDVCHSATPALASNGDMPCVSECPCRTCQPAQTAVASVENSLFNPFLIVLQDERPPKA